MPIATPPARERAARAIRPPPVAPPRRRAAPRARAASLVRALAVVAIVSGAAVRPPAAEARESDLRQPIDVRADRSEYDERAGTQTLIGNVEISQGTMRISAERVAIRLRDSRLARIEGTGSPIRFEQENEAGESIRGEAREISYDATSGTLVLSGTATLARPGQTLTSERIVFDARTQKVSAEGGPGADGEPGGGRVSIRLEPPPADGTR